MDKISIILSGLITIALAIMFAPSILALNRGKVLRNAAAWLAIFLLLGLMYQTFGPGKHMPTGLSNQNNEKTDNEPADGEQSGSDQGYVPPKD